MAIFAPKKPFSFACDRNTRQYSLQYNLIHIHKIYEKKKNTKNKKQTTSIRCAVTETKGDFFVICSPRYGTATLYIETKQRDIKNYPYKYHYLFFFFSLRGEDKRQKRHNMY